MDTAHGHKTRRTQEVYTKAAEFLASARFALPHLEQLTRVVTVRLSQTYREYDEVARELRHLKDPRKREPKLAQMESLRLKQQQLRDEESLLERQLHSGKLELTSSRKLLKAAVCDYTDRDYEAAAMAKLALREVAMNLDPASTRCAELLGRLYLRCPKCVSELSLLDRRKLAIGREHFEKHKSTIQGSTPHGLLGIEAEKEPEEEEEESEIHFVQALFADIPLDDQHLHTDNSWDALKHIDNMLTKASRQSATSLENLFGVLSCESLHGQTKAHLLRVINDAAPQLLREDAGLIQRTPKLSTALSVRWPAAAEFSTAQNMTAYQALSALAHQVLEMEMESYEAKICELDSAQLASQTAHRGSTDAGGCAPSKTASAPPKKPGDYGIAEPTLDGVLEDLQIMIDKKFESENTKERGMLHWTPTACEALRRIAFRSAVPFLRAEAALYGEDRYLCCDPQHWFHRRQAAMTVCAAALDDNRWAQKLLLEKLLHDKHWAVKQVALEHACKLLGLAFDSGSEAFFDDLVKEVLQALCAVPPRDEESSVVLEQCRTLQCHTEACLLKEMQAYSPACLLEIAHKLRFFGSSIPHYMVDFVENAREVCTRVLAVRAQEIDHARTCTKSTDKDPKFAVNLLHEQRMRTLRQ